MAPDLITRPVTTDLLRGAVEVEETDRGLLPHRLPAWVRRQFPDAQLLMAESQPSGVRVCLRTAATVLELDGVPTKREYVGAGRRPDGVYDLVVDGAVTGDATMPGGDTLTIDPSNGATALEQGEVGTLRFDGLPAGAKEVEIWLPHDETVRLIALRSDAPLEPAPPTESLRWLHHGSSISHGSNAERPTATWPAVVARTAGVDLLNLGLGGSALLDPFVARTLRDLPADVISMKLGINLVNADLMRLRAFVPAVHGLLDTIRDGHPSTPLLLVGPVHCPIHEDTPGPCEFDPEALAAGRVAFRATGDPAERAAGKLTLGVVRDELERLVAERAGTDPHLHYLDGRELYGDSDHAELPLPDRLHPDTATHRRIGERFAGLAFGDGRPFPAGTR